MPPLGESGVCPLIVVFSSQKQSIHKRWLNSNCIVTAKGEFKESLHGHLNGAFGIAFSPDGRRLISASGGREAVKLWDVGTRQELLTLVGIDSSLYMARWSADGNVILAGPPWQAWSAPSWE
jgi:WD40 repeat protein